MSVPATPEPGDDFVSTAELVRRQGVEPWRSIEDLDREDPFSSDEEYAEFLRDLYHSRRASAL